MSLQTDAPAPAWAPGAAIAAAGLVVLLAFLSGGTRGVGAADRDYWFSPTDQPVAQSMLPALDSPYAKPWTPSSLTGRGAMAIALGRRTALRDLAAALSAGSVVLMGVWLVGAGVPTFPVLIAMLGMGASPTLWGRGIYWTADAMSPLLALFAMWAGWRWAANRRLIVLALAIVAAALAITENPAWVCCLPAAAVFAASRVESRGHQLVAVVVVAALAACALLGGLVPWSHLIGVDVPSMATRVGNLVREFTPIGATLVVIGVTILATVRQDRLALAVLAAGLLCWQWLVPHSILEPVSLPLAIMGWAAVAVAIQWVQHTMSEFGARTLVTVLGVLIIGEPTLIRERMSALGQDARSEEAAHEWRTALK